MPERILITGGAGFIGARLAQRLLASGREVRIIDSLLAQVHGPDPALPSWLRNDCDLHVADIRDRSAVEHAVRDIDAVVHLAADTGTAQSMYEIQRYVDVNVGGTAMLLECMIPHAGRIRKLVVASSRAVYGEGKYECARCDMVYPPGRSSDALAAGRWEPLCPRCGGPINAVATDEDSPTHPTSIYGATKLAQEQLAETFGGAYHVRVVSLRYQNVYGAGQSLANPYVGILTHFFSAALRGEAPRVFEDGLPSRDFVHVDDVITATEKALASDAVGVMNAGTGSRTTILEVAEAICDAVAPGLKPAVVPQYRIGDIRHCYADIRRAASHLGYTPHVKLTDGLQEFVEWAATETQPALQLVASNRELVKHGLLRSAGNRDTTGTKEERPG